MENTTIKNPNTLSKRLAQYGALSLAIAGVADATGQISYTDVDPDFVGALQSAFDIDFNGDTIIDATIFQNSFSTSSGTIQLLRAEAASGNGIVANIVGGFNYASNIPAGSAIGSGATVASFGDMCQAGGYTNSGFCGTAAESYIGVAFDVSGSTHYGWVRLAAGSSSSNFTILDYAYEMTANTSINAGQTLGVDDVTTTSIKVVALKNSVGLYNLTQATKYRVYDLSGKSVLEGITNNDNYIIEARGIANGIYIIELSDNNSNAVLRKKIVL